MMKLNKLLNIYKGKISILTVAVVLSITINPRESRAALKDAMNQMFVSTSTSPQTINSQRLLGVYGGSLTIRSPGRGIEVVQFARPRVDAGCGGIDIFFGSFSFINGAQFEQLVRSIAANAVGFAIKAAINSMCSPCGAILQDLESAMRELNAMAKNTCAIANAAFDDGARDKLKEQARKVGANLQNVFSRVSDTVAGENKSLSETPSETSGSNDAKIADSNPIMGNLVYKAGVQTMPNGGNILKSFMSTQQAIEYAMSLFGTQINRPKDPNAACDSEAPAERCDKPIEEVGASIASWDQFFYPKDHAPNGLSIQRCDNFTAGCTKVSPSITSSSDWSGVTDLINIGLYGTDKPENRASWSGNSLIGSFALNSGIASNGGTVSTSTLSTQAQTVLAMTPVPVLTMLMETQRIPGAAETMGEILAQQLPKFVAYRIGTDMLSLGYSVFTKQTEAGMPAGYRNELNLKSSALTAYRPNAQELTALMKGTYDSMIMSQTLTASPIRTTGNK